MFRRSAQWAAPQGSRPGLSGLVWSQWLLRAPQWVFAVCFLEAALGCGQSHSGFDEMDVMQRSAGGSSRWRLCSVGALGASCLGAAAGGLAAS